MIQLIVSMSRLISYSFPRISVFGSLWFFFFCCILLQCSVMGLVQKVRLVTEVVVLNVPNF